MRKVLCEIPKWMLAILVGVILANIKRVFLDFDVDCEYAIAQSYRMARGDHMIAQMWEPHQTSAFLNAVFIKIYLLLTGTTTGIALYLNIVGLGAKLGVAYVFYRTFRKYCNHNILFFMCAFFMTVNAKNFMILDFSNMMVYFSVLLCCSLFTYLQRQGETGRKNFFLVLAAVCFCLEVLSYPSAIILFPLMLVLLCRYSVTKGKDMWVFSGVCFAFGCTYLGILTAQAGWSQFWTSVNYIITGDETHQVGKFAVQLKTYAAEAGSVAVLFGGCAILSFLSGKASAGRSGILTKFDYVKRFFIFLLSYNFIHILIDLSENGFHVIFRLLYVAVYIPILFFAFILRENCDREERMAFDIGAEISLWSCVAVLLLTNLTLLTTVAYLTLGIMVSMMPIGKYLQKTMPNEKRMKMYGMFILFLAVVIFKNIYVFRPCNRLHATILSVRNVVRDGPMLGTFSDYMGAYIRNANLIDWRQYVHEGDKVLIVGYPVSTIGYLYEDTEICVDSTISSPTYSEKLLSYWELNPWKEPDVVVLDCWFGEPHFPEDEWIMEWIGENFDSYVNGTYIRVYRKEW